jgi:hypothetical protein
MEIVEFNGLGQPMLGNVKSGDVLVVFNGEATQIVKLKILPPEEYGPELTPAENWAQIESELEILVRANFPHCMGQERHWVFTCPESIRIKAIFNEHA